MSAQSVSSTVGGLYANPTRSSPASVFWNPATIGTYSDTQLETNLTLIGGWLIYDRDGQDPYTGRGYDSVSTSVLAPTPFLSVSSPLSTEHFRFGYATYFPSGAIGNFEEDGAQRYELISGMLLPWNHQFTLAYTPNSEWSFAVSGIYSLAFFRTELDVDLGPTVSSLLENTEIPQGHPALSSRIKIPTTTSHRFGGSFGVIYRPSLQWSFGASLLLPINYEFSQDLSVQMPNLVTALGATAPALGVEETTINKAKVKIQSPPVVNFGFRYQPFGYWTGEYFGRYAFSSQTRFTTVEFTASPIQKISEREILGLKASDSYMFGTTQSFSLWRRFLFGLSSTYSVSGVEQRKLSTSRVDFDSLMVGGFLKYRFNQNLRIGGEYSHHFMFERTVKGSLGSDSPLGLFRSPSTDGRYRAGLDRIGASLSYAF